MDASGLYDGKAATVPTWLLRRSPLFALFLATNDVLGSSNFPVQKDN